MSPRYPLFRGFTVYTTGTIADLRLRHDASSAGPAVESGVGRQDRQFHLQAGLEHAGRHKRPESCRVIRGPG